jgi:hypothetical protein
MTHHHRRALAIVAVAAPLLLSCSDEALLPPQPVAEMFSRYAALGNSLTAGFQSGGINDSTQLESYAIVLAQAMGLEIGRDFTYPSLAMPGCPPPLVNIFTQETIDTIPVTNCAFRGELPRQINNVAVPGAAVIDVLSNLDPASNPNPLTSQMLGGRTQAEAASLIGPTFASVFIGNNDILGAITDQTNPGDPGLITRVGDFRSSYDSIMAVLDSLPTLQGGILIGVVQVTFAPYASSGAAYWLASQTIADLTVDNNCLDQQEIAGTTDSASVLIPFHYAAPIMAAAAAGVPQTIDCSVDAVISAAEAAFMVLVVGAYNDIIEEHATSREWAYLDPNIILDDLLQDPTKIRPFPAYDPADPQHLTAPFGTALSRDGVHPSAESHRVLANALATAINATYGTSLSEQ